MYTIEFKPRIPAGISHLRICTRFPSYLNYSRLGKGKTITRDAKSILEILEKGGKPKVLEYMV